MLGIAIAITAEAFKDRKDKGGKPYILHCLRVMNSVRHLGEEVMSIAIMHDLLEDCDEWNYDRLIQMKFSQRVVWGVMCMTHDNRDSYDEYIKKIALNEDARQVKMADLKDNSDITRLKGVSKKDWDRLEKYGKAFKYLEKV